MSITYSNTFDGFLVSLIDDVQAIEQILTNLAGTADSTISPRVSNDINVITSKWSKLIPNFSYIQSVNSGIVFREIERLLSDMRRYLKGDVATFVNDITTVSGSSSGSFQIDDLARSGVSSGDTVKINAGYRLNAQISKWRLDFPNIDQMHVDSAERRTTQSLAQWRNMAKQFLIEIYPSHHPIGLSNKTHKPNDIELAALRATPTLTAFSDINSVGKSNIDHEGCGTIIHPDVYADTLAGINKCLNSGGVDIVFGADVGEASTTLLEVESYGIQNVEVTMRVTVKSTANGCRFAYIDGTTTTISSLEAITGSLHLVNPVGDAIQLDLSGSASQVFTFNIPSGTSASAPSSLSIDLDDTTVGYTNNIMQGPSTTLSCLSFEYISITPTDASLWTTTGYDAAQRTGASISSYIGSFNGESIRRYLSPQINQIFVELRAYNEYLVAKGQNTIVDQMNELYNITKTSDDNATSIRNDVLTLDFWFSTAGSITASTKASMYRHFVGYLTDYVNFIGVNFDYHEWKHGRV